MRHEGKVYRFCDGNVTAPRAQDQQESCELRCIRLARQAAYSKYAWKMC